MVFLNLNQPVSISPRPGNPAGRNRVYTGPISLLSARPGNVGYVLPSYLAQQVPAHTAHLILPPLDPQLQFNSVKLEVINPYDLPAQFNLDQLRTYTDQFPLTSDSLNVTAEAGISTPGSNSAVFKLAVGRKSTDSPKQALFRVQVQMLLWKIAIRAYPKMSLGKTPGGSEPIKLNQDLSIIFSLSDLIVGLANEDPYHSKIILAALSSWEQSHYPHGSDSPSRILDLRNEIYNSLYTLINQPVRTNTEDLFGITNRKNQKAHPLFQERTNPDEIVGEKPKPIGEGLGEFPDQNDPTVGDTEKPDRIEAPPPHEAPDKPDVEDAEETWEAHFSELGEDEALDPDRILTPEEIAQIEDPEERIRQRDRLILDRLLEDEELIHYGNLLARALNGGDGNIDHNDYHGLARRISDRILEITGEITDQINNHRKDDAILGFNRPEGILRIMAQRIDPTQLNQAEQLIIELLTHLNPETHHRQLIALAILIQANSRLQRPEDLAALVQLTNDHILTNTNIPEGLANFRQTLEGNILRVYENRVAEFRRNLDDRLGTLRASTVERVAGLSVQELQRLGRAFIEGCRAEHRSLKDLGRRIAQLLNGNNVDLENQEWITLQGEVRQTLLRVLRNSGAREHVGLPDGMEREIAIASIQAALQHGDIETEHQQLALLIAIGLEQEEANRFDLLAAAGSVFHGGITQPYADAYLELVYLATHTDMTEADTIRWLDARLNQIFRQRAEQDLPQAVSEIEQLFRQMFNPTLGGTIDNTGPVRDRIRSFLPMVAQNEIEYYFPLLRPELREQAGDTFPLYIAEVLVMIDRQRGPMTEAEMIQVFNHLECLVFPNILHDNPNQEETIRRLGNLIYPYPEHFDGNHFSNAINILDTMIAVLPERSPTRENAITLRERINDIIRQTLRNTATRFGYNSLDELLFDVAQARVNTLIANNHGQHAYNFSIPQNRYVWGLFENEDLARAIRLQLQIPLETMIDHNQREFYETMLTLWGELGIAVGRISNTHPLYEQINQGCINAALQMIDAAIHFTHGNTYAGLRGLVRNFINRHRSNRERVVNHDLRFALEFLHFIIEHHNGLSLSRDRRQEILRELDTLLNP